MTEYGYTQNDNESNVEFQEDGVAKDLSAATKLEVQLFSKKRDPVDRVAPAATFNSMDDSALFDLTDISTGRMSFKPDSTALTGLTQAKYYGRCVVYAADYPNGKVWAKSHDDLFDYRISR